MRTVVWGNRCSCLQFPMHLLAHLMMSFCFETKDLGIPLYLSNWMWQFPNRFREWAAVTPMQVTSVYSSVCRIFLKSFSQWIRNHTWKASFPFKWKFFTYVSSILTLKKIKGFYLQKEVYVLDSYNQCWTSANSSYVQGFPWCTLLRAHKELSSCTSQLWASSSACLADLPC